ncbi:MAG: hypothetical protein H7840_01510 [Alphaproteobacteria bacterium]
MATEQAFPAETCQCKVKAQRFAEFVRLHATEGGVLSAEDELKVLRTGVSEFGLGLDEAKGILLGVAADRRIALESQVERHLGHFLGPAGKNRKVSREKFNEAVEFYKRLTYESVSQTDAEKRVKAVMERTGLKPRRSWSRLGSRKWYNRIKA